tara:strand:- start:1313 stop:2545 length:1233 start_codon:yes stop_codon:yes gene_type:complete
MIFRNRIFNHRLIANLIGATLDKTLPLIIAFFLTNYMSNESFGYWTQYFVILVVVSSTIISPFQLFFSRDFSQKKTKNVLLFNFPIILGIFLITSLIIFVFFKALIIQSYVFEMISIIFLFIIYMLNATYLRFNEMDVKYAKFSLLRVLLFLGSILFIITNDFELNFRNLIHSFLIAHIPFVFAISKNIIISWEIKKKSLGEFLRLSFYGLSTALLSGVDKLIIVFAGYSYEDLSFYAYAIAFASLPSFLVEAVKQYMSPKLYHDLSKFKDYSKKTTYLLLKFIVALIVIQFTLPYAGFKIFEYFNILNLGYIRSDNFFLLLNIFNVGFSFHIIYHFLNPYMFFYDRSIYLLILQSCSILVYSVFVIFSKNLSDDLFAIIRAFMFIIVVVGTAIPLFNKRLKNKYVYKEL